MLKLNKILKISAILFVILVVIISLLITIFGFERLVTPLIMKYEEITTRDEVEAFRNKEKQCFEKIYKSNKLLKPYLLDLSIKEILDNLKIDLLGMTNSRLLQSVDNKETYGIYLSTSDYKKILVVYFNENSNIKGEIEIKSVIDMFNSLRSDGLEYSDDIQKTYEFLGLIPHHGGCDEYGHILDIFSPKTGYKYKFFWDSNGNLLKKEVIPGTTTLEELGGE